MLQPYLPYIRGTFGVTMEHASFVERFYNTIIVPLTTEYDLQPYYQFQHEILKEVGVQPYSGITYNFDKSLVFVRSLPGIDVSLIKRISDNA
jgi:hypothetical protein